MDEKQVLSSFYIVGISHKKADALVRGRFAIGESAYENLLFCKDNFGIREFFVLSTCNRTELYGVAGSPEALTHFLLTQTQGGLVEFRSFAYIKEGQEAVQHLFEVAAGLDSQILGDSDIIGQIRSSVKRAKAHGAIGSFLDRLLNSVFQSSKSVKNRTKLSSGAVSLSLSAVHFLTHTVPNLADRTIVLVGAGRFGRSIGRLLVQRIGVRRLTVVNRTLSRAEALAAEWGVNAAPLVELPTLLAKSDVLILATGAPEPLIYKAHLIGMEKKVLLDLSVPTNIEKEAAALSNVLVLGIDKLCDLTDAQLAGRHAELPHARAVLETHIREFLEWCESRRYTPALHTLHQKLKELQSAFDCHGRHGRHPMGIEVQKLVNKAALRIKQGQNQGCQMVQVMYELVQSATR